MQQFSPAFISRLNAVYGAGVFLRGLVIALTDRTDYWVENHDPITFRGHIYQPLPQMLWEGVEASAVMSLPAVRVSLANIHGQVESYIEDNALLGHDVTLQIFHLDLLGNPADCIEFALQVQQIEYNAQAITATCGLNLGLEDLLPKGVITQSEFPSNSDDVMRVTIL